MQVATCICLYYFINRHYRTLKKYDSIDRQTLFHVLEEFGVDRKTREIVSEKFTDAILKTKFRLDVSETFAIMTGVRQGDGLSPVLCNIVLEEVMQIWKKSMKEIIEGTCLGPKRRECGGTHRRISC